MATPDKLSTSRDGGKVSDFVRRNLARAAVTGMVGVGSIGAIEAATADSTPAGPNIIAPPATVHPTEPKPIDVPVTPNSVVTMDQLKALPTQTEVVHAGEGADDAIIDVDPEAFANNDQVRAELREIVSEQAGQPNGSFTPEQTVEVPQIPGEPVSLPPDAGTHVG